MQTYYTDPYKVELCARRSYHGGRVCTIMGLWCGGASLTVFERIFISACTIRRVESLHFRVRFPFPNPQQFGSSLVISKDANKAEIRSGVGAWADGLSRCFAVLKRTILTMEFHMAWLRLGLTVLKRPCIKSSSRQSRCRQGHGGL